MSDKPDVVALLRRAMTDSCVTSGENQGPGCFFCDTEDDHADDCEAVAALEAREIPRDAEALAKRIEGKLEDVIVGFIQEQFGSPGISFDDLPDMGAIIAREVALLFPQPDRHSAAWNQEIAGLKAELQRMTEMRDKAGGLYHDAKAERDALQKWLLRCVQEWQQIYKLEQRDRDEIEKLIGYEE